MEYPHKLKNVTWLKVFLYRTNMRRLLIFQPFGNCLCSGIFHLHNIWHFPMFQPIGNCLFLFSQVEIEAVAHDTVVVISTSSASFPPGFFGFGDRLSTYSQLFVLSLLIQLFVLISLPSWPFEVLSSSLLFSPLMLNLLLSFVLVHL